MPTTYDLTGPFAGGPGRLQCVKKVVDFNKTPLAASDKAKLFNVPAGVMIDHLKANRITAEGAAATVDVGLYAASNDAAVDADGLLDGLDVNATGYAASRPGVLAQGTPNTFNPAFSNGYLTTAPVWVGLLANDALDLAEIEFELFYIV